MEERNLFGESAPPRKRRKADPVPLDTGPVRQCFDRFHECHEARWKIPPNFRKSPALYGRRFKELVEQYGVERVLELIGMFFSVKGDWKVDRCDFSVSAFYALAEHLNLMDRRANPDSKAAHNVTAAARAMEKR